jgi:hypothetical protein
MSTRALRARPRTRPGGAVRARRALVLAGCGVLSVGLCACESTEQESAQIGRESVPAAHAPAKSPSSARAANRSRGHGADRHGRPAKGQG